MEVIQYDTNTVHEWSIQDIATDCYEHIVEFLNFDVENLMLVNKSLLYMIGMAILNVFNDRFKQKYYNMIKRMKEDKDSPIKRTFQFTETIVRIKRINNLNSLRNEVKPVREFFQKYMNYCCVPKKNFEIKTKEYNQLSSILRYKNRRKDLSIPKIFDFSKKETRDLLTICRRNEHPCFKISFYLSYGNINGMKTTIRTFMNKEDIQGSIIQHSIAKKDQRTVYCKLYFHMFKFKTPLDNFKGYRVFDSLFQKLVKFITEKYHTRKLDLQFKDICASLNLAPPISRFFIKRTRPTMENIILDKSGIGEEELKYKKNPMPFLVIPEADEDIQKTVNTLLSSYREEYIRIEKEIEHLKQENKTAEKKTAEAEKKTVKAEKKTVEAEKKTIEAEKKTAEAEKKTVEAERKTIEAEKKTVEAERKIVEAEKKTIEANRRIANLEKKMNIFLIVIVIFVIILLFRKF